MASVQRPHGRFVVAGIDGEANPPTSRKIVDPDFSIGLSDRDYEAATVGRQAGFSDRAAAFHTE